MRHGKGQRSTIPTIMVGVAQVFASTNPMLELELELDCRDIGAQYHG